jgi:sodium-dependent dicarboxylate transporter 2/3/5
MGAFKIRGWSNLFNHPAYIHDGTVAIIMALLLFIFPAKSEKGRGIIIWEDIHKLPFDIILLFGGGFALAKGLEVSGLSAWLAGGINLSGLNSYFLLMIVMCSLICLISEFASNVACIQLMIPLLVAVLPSTGLHPLLLLVPATLASSLGFMLPVATAPNTIVFGSKRITVNQMMRAGILVDFIGIVLITVLMVAYKYLFF